MKHFIKLSLPLALVVGFTPPCFGVTSICLSLENCADQLTSGLLAYTYCCPTGETKTQITYTCPTGWSNVGGTCQRASVGGTDAKGAYTTTYGTCDATTSTSIIQCYELSNNSTTSDGFACHTASGL